MLRGYRGTGIQAFQSPKYEYFYLLIAGTIDARMSMFWRVFWEEFRAKDFLTNILIWDVKIWPKGIKIEKIEYLPSEHIQPMNVSTTKEKLFDLQVKINHGWYIFDLQRNYVPQKEF